MELDALALIVGQAARLVEDRVRDCELADVVQKAGTAEVSQPLWSSPSAIAVGNGELGDARRMAIGVRRLRIDHECKGLSDAIKAIAVGEDRLLERLERNHPRGEIVRRASDRQNGDRCGATESTSTSAGSNQVPLA